MSHLTLLCVHIRLRDTICKHVISRLIRLVLITRSHLLYWILHLYHLLILKDTSFSGKFLGAKYNIHSEPMHSGRRNSIFIVEEEILFWLHIVLCNVKNVSLILKIGINGISELVPAGITWCWNTDIFCRAKWKAELLLPAEALGIVSAPEPGHTQWTQQSSLSVQWWVHILTDLDLISHSMFQVVITVQMLGWYCWLRA